MAEIEIVLTLVENEATPVEADLARQEQRRADRELLELIKAYGRFNEDGEWEQ